jgi:hypothetical protein
MTLSKLTKALGYDVEVHGFRTYFKRWAQERPHTPRDGAVRQIRTRLCKDSEAAPYVAPRARHSARAAARVSLRFDRL